jgi:hypothetical protein
MDPGHIRSSLESVIAGMSGIISTLIRIKEGPRLSGMSGSSVDIAAPHAFSLAAAKLDATVNPMEEIPHVVVVGSI